MKLSRNRSNSQLRRLAGLKKSKSILSWNLSWATFSEDFYQAVFRHVYPILQRKGSDTKLLEVGCGYGHFLKIIEENACALMDAVGLDISIVNLSKASKMLVKTSLILGDAIALPFKS